MKRKPITTFSLMIGLFLASCGGNPEQPAAEQAQEESVPAAAGQSAVKDDESQKNIVSVAVGSADHTTLVAAVKAAQLVDVLSNAGPFTVFAPTNAAFEALPAGTVDNLLKPENIGQLQDILQYHVAVAVLKPELLQDGQKLQMVNGGYATIKKDGDKLMINDANVLGSVPASNGLVYVIDKVILPSN
jgi:uncharacterized surface protein with fasciclin (FAS1) repeats